MKGECPVETGNSENMLQSKSLCCVRVRQVAERDRQAPGTVQWTVVLIGVTLGPNRLEVRTTRCGRVNPGSIPGSDTFAGSRCGEIRPRLPLPMQTPF